LALTGIEIAKLLDEITVAPNRCLHKVSAPFLGDAGGLVHKQARDRLLVTGKQECLQSLLGEQPGAGLIWRCLGIHAKASVIRLVEWPDGGVALK
jgi:hypothetical protein